VTVTGSSRSGSKHLLVHQQAEGPALEMSWVPAWVRAGAQAWGRA
jgi:hypothetical protein